MSKKQKQKRSSFQGDVSRASIQGHFHQFYRMLLLADDANMASRLFQHLEAYYRTIIKEMCKTMKEKCEDLQSGYKLKGRDFVRRSLDKIQLLHPDMKEYQHRVEHASVGDFIKELESFGIETSHIVALETADTPKKVKETAKKMWSAVKKKISSHHGRRKTAKYYGHVDPDQDTWGWKDYAYAASLLLGAGGLAVMYGPASIANTVGYVGAEGLNAVHSGITAIPYAGSYLGPMTSGISTSADMIARSSAMTADALAKAGGLTELGTAAIGHAGTATSWASILGLSALWSNAKKHVLVHKPKIKIR